MIYDFGTPERLRTLRCTLFTGRGVKGNGKQCLELLRAKAGQISLVLLDIPHLLKVLDEALK